MTLPNVPPCADTVQAQGNAFEINPSSLPQNKHAPSNLQIRIPTTTSDCGDQGNMIENQKIRPAQVIGPLGEPLTLDTLPPPSTTRWVVRRKAEVVAAVNGGLLTIDEVCARYGLTLEEFAPWQRAVDRSGMPGLRVTRLQHYRDLYERQQRY